MDCCCNQGVGVENVTSISRMRFSRSMLEELAMSSLAWRSNQAVRVLLPFFRDT